MDTRTEEKAAPKIESVLIDIGVLMIWARWALKEQKECPKKD